MNIISLMKHHLTMFNIFPLQIFMGPKAPNSFISSRYYTRGSLFIVSTTGYPTPLLTSALLRIFAGDHLVFFMLNVFTVTGLVFTFRPFFVRGSAKH